MTSRDRFLAAGLALLLGAISAAASLLWNVFGLGESHQALASALSGGIVGPLLVILVFAPLRARVASRESALRAQTERQEFEGRLTRALERSGTEEAALDVAMRAVDLSAPGTPAQLLLADSSQAHLRQAVTTGGMDTAAGTGCGVTSPWDCPAIASARTLTFDSSDDLDACRHLRNRPGGPHTGVCLPLSTMGRVLGVMHVARPADQPVDDETVQRLRMTAGRTGATVGMLRAFAKSQLQASTDPLTGLLNRRSLEDRARPEATGSSGFAVLMADLDRFKQLNDVHGHPAGDRALRIFSEVLRSAVRDTDLVGRWGGEEFVVVLPGADAQVAVALAERLRRRLAEVVAASGSATFTSSFGAADTACAPDLAGVVAAADAALFEAKRAGRDRVCAARQGATGAIPAPREASAAAA